MLDWTKNRKKDIDKFNLGSFSVGITMCVFGKPQIAEGSILVALPAPAHMTITAAQATWL